MGNLKSVKKAVSVARFVMNSTQHSLLVGQSATDFAKQMGLPIESLSSSVSKVGQSQSISLLLSLNDSLSRKVEI